MNKNISVLVLFLIGILILTSCDNEDIIPDPGVQTSFPAIDSITASKSIVKFGGQEPTIISVFAHGGSLSFTWEVDLGDIIPQNTDASIVSFTGSPCCIGEKEIKCTAINDKGSTSKIITITIVE